MGTVVKFKPNIDYYYSRGLSLYENDNFIDALKSYREAYKMAENGGEEFRSLLEVEMACCYRNLNLMREAQLMYYKALGDSNPDAAFDSVIGLIDLFGTTGNDDALKYYMDMAAKRGFSRELDYIDAASQFFAQRDYRVEPTPDKNMLELGKKLTEAGQFDFARQLLEVIPSDTPSYGESCVKLAALYNAAGEHEKALRYLEKSNVQTVETSINTVLALYKLQRTEAYEAALSELAETDTDDIAELSGIVRTMALVNNGDMVIRFGRRLAQISPQRAPMLSYALALCNVGDLREARKIMVMLQALYPYDAPVRVFSYVIGNLTEKANFSLTGELPEQAEESILAELNGVLSECGGDRGELRKRLRDPDLYTGVLMIFQAGSDNSKRLLCDVVADIPFFERYIRDALIDPGFSDADKRLLLPVALRRFRKRPVFLTCRDICRPLYGRPPAKVSHRWKEVYCLAYGAAALFGCENFEREFDAAFLRLHEAVTLDDPSDDAAVAAVLTNRLHLVPPLSDDECCIELFGADKEKYRKFKQASAGVGNRDKKRNARKK